jgi:hypothetical protein
MEKVAVKPHGVVSAYSLSKGGVQALGDIQVSLKLTILKVEGTSKLTLWASRPMYPNQFDASPGLIRVASFLKMKENADAVVELTVSYIGYHSTMPLGSNTIFSDHRSSETYSYLPQKIRISDQELESMNGMVLKRLLHSGPKELELIAMRKADDQSDKRLNGKKWYEYSILLRAREENSELS